MRILRKKLIIRPLALCMIIVLLGPIIGSTQVFALTHGPHQPEFTAYEEPGATDLVNLFTGDFAYNLQLLHIPGPEGGFDLPLAYHAGIGVEQEASWVGLGWSMNAGAITRNIVGFPDDASNVSQYVQAYDPGVEGYYVKTIWGTYGYRSDVGKYGGLSIGFMQYNHASGSWKADPVKIAMMALDAATMGGASATTQIASKVISKGMEIGTNLSSPSGMPAVPNDPYWNWSKSTHRSGFLGMKKNYKIWLEDSRFERMYGALYLQDAPTQVNTNSWLNVKVNNSTPQPFNQFLRSDDLINYGAASDILFNTYNEMEISPISLAYDDYRVMGQGVSGSIEPYRMDVGAVSTPREMTSKHTRLAPVKFYAHNHSSQQSVNQKVPFIYQGAFQNAHFRNIGGTSVPQTPDPATYHFGVSNTKSGSGANWKYTLNFSDHMYGDGNRVDPLIEQNYGYKIPAGNHIEWFTAKDIAPNAQSKGEAFGRGYIDFIVNNSDRHEYRFNKGVKQVQKEYTSYDPSLNATEDRSLTFDEPENSGKTEPLIPE